jgi:metallophosphoesterase (TIGR03767 family)
MPRMRRILSAAAALGLLALAPASFADPTGRSTLRETVQPGSGSGFVPLVKGDGEPYVVRRGGSAKAKAKRAGRRRSLAFFAQLTDPQIADEMSPARVDFVDPAGGALKSAWRPQEALGLQTFDAIVRNINANRQSTVRGAKGRRARLGFAITTGDLADNQQFNETNWFRTVLDGGMVDPFSGRAIDASNPCGAPPDVVARLNDDVAARRYTGVADYDDWRGAPTDRYAGFYDPDEAAPTAGPYAAFPRYPGLLERAQAAFRAQGLDVPWYISRGNHDGLIQGNAPASTDLFRQIAIGCLKVFPNPQIDPAAFAGASESELFQRFSDPAFIASLLAGGRMVPPDPDRRIVSKTEYRQLMREGDRNAHGFGDTSRSELSKSGGTASYYATTPKRGVRIISLDTVAEGGGQNGNLDDPQYRWLKRELRKARRRGQLVVVFGHHTLETMSNATADEAAGACQPADEPGCDADPRTSAPLHLGTTGKATVRALLAGTPNVVAYVAGHTHLNKVTFNGGRRGGGFWEINTASHIDWPQQSRLIELMDNRDGTISIFGTMLDAAAPQAAPASGSALGMSLSQLVSLGRTLSYNDPQREGAEGSGDTESKTGARRDRNVELLVRDPR